MSVRFSSVITALVLVYFVIFFLSLRSQQDNAALSDAPLDDNEERTPFKCMSAGAGKWHCPPDHLGIGFPKCGSSSLFRFLNQHPLVHIKQLSQQIPHPAYAERLLHAQVRMWQGGRQKEAHFFHRPSIFVARTRRRYLAEFPVVSKEDLGRVNLGEHTPGYVWRVPYQCEESHSSKTK